MPALLQEPTSEFSLHHADSNAPPSPSVVDAVAYALQQCPGFSFLPSNNDSQGAFPHDISSSAASQFSCDDFRIYEFKVRRCMRGRSHDWTECPFAHPGEKARRRDPRRVHYSGTPCPDFRKGSCRRGEACEFAHGVFECWLHPARYRTQVCKDGKNCKRRVCFFAHSPEQLRILPVSMAPTTMPDVSPASSTRGLASSLNIALEDTISSMPRRMSRGHAFICSPPSSLSSTLAHPSNQVNQDTFQHLESASNTTSLRRAVMQNMLACTGYGVNLNSSDFPSVSDCFEGLSESQALYSLYSGLQSHRNIYSNFNFPIEQTPYELANYSHGFASPTSTLDGSMFSPPPLSPPLSPMNSSSKEVKDIVTGSLTDFNCFLFNDGFVQSDVVEPCTGSDGWSSIQALGFHLQNLQLTSGSGTKVLPQYPDGILPGGKDRYFQQSKWPFLGHELQNSCTSIDALWGTSRGFPDSEFRVLDASQERDGCAFDLIPSKGGDECVNSDSLIPDFGWLFRNRKALRWWSPIFPSKVEMRSCYLLGVHVVYFVLKSFNYIRRNKH